MADELSILTKALNPQTVGEVSRLKDKDILIAMTGVDSTPVFVNGKDIVELRLTRRQQLVFDQLMKGDKIVVMVYNSGKASEYSNYEWKSSADPCHKTVFWKLMQKIYKDINDTKIIDDINNRYFTGERIKTGY